MTKINRRRKSINLIDMIKSVRREIKFTFLVSIFSIILIEVLFKNYNSPSNLFYVIGDIYLKVCYSIIPTTVFFIMNQHIPKETRNVKTNRYITNKLVMVGNELFNLIESLGNIDKEQIPSEEQILELCKSINPSTPIAERSSLIFPNWREYMKFKTAKINRLLNDVLILNPTIETEILGHIVNMLDALEQFYYVDNYNVSLGNNLTFYANPISYLLEEDAQIRKIIRTGKYKIYTQTNMNDYHNSRKKQTTTANS
jgi:hypothetical protein